MSPLRERMNEDMTLAGLALGTRQAYTQAVRRLAGVCPVLCVSGSLGPILTEKGNHDEKHD